MLQLLETEAKFQSLACHLQFEVKGVSPKAKDNFGPGAAYKSPLCFLTTVCKLKQERLTLVTTKGPCHVRDNGSGGEHIV